MNDPANPDLAPDSDAAPQTHSSGSIFLAWLRLLRLPNVFSAWADVLLGWFAATAFGFDQPHLLLLLAASSCLYLGGMVLNDYYDVEEDRRDRPFRPIPSGKASASAARRTGFALLAGGLFFAAAAALVGPTAAPLLVAVPLAVLVWGYDAGLKATWMGPLAMGGCRALNVLLGMNAPLESWRWGFLAVAGVMGLYIVGVTTFARTEAAPKGRGSLILGTLLVAAAFGALLVLPTQLQAWGWPRPTIDLRWSLLVCILWLLVLQRLLPAILSPSAASIQTGVRQCLQSYVLIAAVAALLFRPQIEAIVILALVLPQMLLARWVYTT